MTIVHPSRSIRTRCTTATLLLVLTVLAVLITLDAIVMPLRPTLDADASGLLRGHDVDLLLMGCGLVLTAGAGFGTWWAVGRVLRPIQAIRGDIDKITANDLGRGLPVPSGSDEIAELVRAANLTFARLEEAVAQQRGFATLASHELRNPLAGLRAELEDALDHPEDSDPRRGLRAALTSVDRLETIVTDLLAQSRVDAAETAVPHELVDLTEVLVQETARVNRTAHGVPVRLYVEGHMWICGSRIQLIRALTNLLGNARRHAFSSVRLSLTRVGDQAAIAVTDDGPGIPPADRQRVFERFVRLDDARRLDAGGSGLGLAITRDIAHRHGGKLTLEDSVAGARFVLWLPLFGAVAETCADGSAVAH
ncbi:sensor histidine kinase [Herbidospora cretacea]|uniref:sensor histidine kinase n=1 Tax=Herbidospora cretacea TaxID=28444 RepID=UPI00068DFB60|nr:HAMP domain-containing sensor histidine kinase [Herbidospora cretacea]